MALNPTSSKGGGSPSGAAGGDLSGTYPNPAVAGITETSGPTDLVIGTINDGEYLKRSGATLVSGSPAGAGTVTSVASGDTSIVVTNPTSTPSLQIATLDVIATNRPPAANWSNNSKKITGLANGASASDAAAFGQIPTALPPNGSAGGDLTGTYPNPTVAASAITTAKLASAVTLDAIATAHATAADVAMASHKMTGLSAGSAAGDSLRMEQLLYSSFHPTTGAIAETHDRKLNSSVSLGAPNSGTLRLFLIWLPVCTVTSIGVMIGSTAMTGGTHGWHALYDINLGLLRQSTDDTSAAATANTMKTYNLSATYSITTAGFYYVGYCYVASQMPTLEGYAGTTSGSYTLAPIVGGNSTASLAGTAPGTAGAITALSGLTYMVVS